MHIIVGTSVSFFILLSVGVGVTARYLLHSGTTGNRPGNVSCQLLHIFSYSVRYLLQLQLPNRVDSMLQESDSVKHTIQVRRRMRNVCSYELMFHVYVMLCIYFKTCEKTRRPTIKVK